MCQDDEGKLCLSRELNSGYLQSLLEVFKVPFSSFLTPFLLLLGISPGHVLVKQMVQIIRSPNLFSPKCQMKAIPVCSCNAPYTWDTV